MLTRMSLRAGLLLACFAGFGTAIAQEPTLEHAQLLMHQFQTNKALVGYAVGMAALRNDLNSRAKPGRIGEVTLTNDFHFSDGTILNKGTVIAGTVNAATNRSKANPESSIVIDWTSAHLPKGVILPIAAAVHAADGN